MNIQAFKATLEDDTPPRDISAPLEALWHQANGDWDSAHGLAQSQPTPMETGFTHIFIVLKVTMTMLLIGITVPVSLFAPHGWLTNGKKLLYTP